MLLVVLWIIISLLVLLVGWSRLYYDNDFDPETVIVWIAVSVLWPLSLFIFVSIILGKHLFQKTNKIWKLYDMYKEQE